MCQLRRPVPEELTEIRRRLSTYLGTKAFSVPIGIGIITRHASPRTLANIFYRSRAPGY